MNNDKKEMILPTLVLFLICLVVTAALAGTYQVTKPLIDNINIVKANEARGEVLPAGEGAFTDTKAELPENVLEIYKANNDSGYVVTSQSKGFGGPVKVMTGIGKDGKIVGVKVTAHTETPGLGTKAMTPDYLAQYKDQTAVTRSGEADKTQIDAIAGATITSDAVFNAVNLAVEEYKKIGGAN